MAATKTVHRLKAIAQRRLLDFDPNATSAVIVDLVPGTADECIPIKNLESLLFGVFHSVGTTDIVGEVFAATDADGGGATTVLAFTAATADIDAVGDTIWLEVDVEQILESLATATHVGLKLTATTATDECVVYFEAHGRFQHADQTANYVS